MLSHQDHGSGRGHSAVPKYDLPSHTPMSERQQLALIKRMELLSNGQNTTPAGASEPEVLTSPPRAPLQVVNGGQLQTTPVSASKALRMKMSATPSPALDRLLKKMSKRNSKGETLLHTAAIRGSCRLVRQLLQLGADPNAQDNAEWSPLHEACNRGNKGVVRILLQHGADLNLKGFAQDAPLHDAARNGHLNVVKVLLQAGADPHAKNAAGRTPLQEAEITLTKVESRELKQTVSYLRKHLSNQNTTLSSSTSDDDGDHDHVAQRDVADECQSDLNDQDDDYDAKELRVEDDDLARFLGFSKSSPEVADAFRCLGLLPSSSSSSSRRSASDKCRPPKRHHISSRRDEEPRRSSHPTKIRLTYDRDDPDKPIVVKSEEQCVKENDSVKQQSSDPVRQAGGGEESCFEKSDFLPLSENESSNPMVSVDWAGRKVLKVPPLKIVLSTTGALTSSASPKLALSSSATSSCSGDTEASVIRPKDTTSKVPLVVHVEMESSMHSAKDTAKDCVARSDQDDCNITDSAVSTSNQYRSKKYKLPISNKSASDIPAADPATSTQKTALRQEPKNDIEKYMELRKALQQRRMKVFQVLPKPPEGFDDYLINRKTYLLQDNAHQRIHRIYRVEPPPSLPTPLRELFQKQEEERYKLRLQHRVEKEKLVLAVEQEILRVHTRAARALANQSLPFSVCTFLRDQEVYNSINEQAPASCASSHAGVKPVSSSYDKCKPDSRSRYNGRLFLSWLQDVDDKWEKIKEQMVLRHHNEAESLNAVQKLDWEWTVMETLGGISSEYTAKDLYIPMVPVTDMFDVDKL